MAVAHLPTTHVAPALLATHAIPVAIEVVNVTPITVTVPTYFGSIPARVAVIAVGVLARVDHFGPGFVL
jgi:hypothetical protein